MPHSIRQLDISYWNVWALEFRGQKFEVSTSRRFVSIDWVASAELILLCLTSSWPHFDQSKEPIIACLKTIIFLLFACQNLKHYKIKITIKIYCKRLRCPLNHEFSDHFAHPHSFPWLRHTRWWTCQSCPSNSGCSECSGPSTESVFSRLSQSGATPTQRGSA